MSDRLEEPRSPPCPPPDRFEGAGAFMALRVDWLNAGVPLPLHLETPTILCTLRSEIVELTADARHLRGAALLDRTRWCLLPRGFVGALSTLSATAHVFLAAVQPPLMRRVADEYAAHGLPLGEVIAICDGVRLLPRTTWVREIVHRYWWERQACGGRSENATTTFLEAELLKEACYLVLEQREGEARVPHFVETIPTLVDRARDAVEEDLFHGWTVGELARRVAASESTLLRAFKRELGMSPGRYVRERRLDESFALLQSGRFTVSEVADHVGYRSASAFADAFRRRFGRAPSEAR